MFDNFKCLVLSHLTAPVEIREKFFLPEQDCKKLLKSIKSVLNPSEVLVLSTCNRTEIYYSAPENLCSEIFGLLSLEKGYSGGEDVRKFFQEINDSAEAARHLFEVSMGLHSRVVGDLQISNQVKTAYSWSAEFECAGPFLHRLLHTIFHANKRVHQETGFRDGAASVSYAAAALGKELAEAHVNPSVLVIGMGEMGRDVARNLSSSFDNIALCNRTQSRAEKLALEIDAKVIPFDKKNDHLSTYTLIFVALNADEKTILKDHFPESDVFRQQYIIDLSVPRAIEEGVEKLPGIVYFSIDEISERTDEVLQMRLKEKARVEEIISEELKGFEDWSQQMSISPTIQKLKEALNDIRKEELARYLKNASEREAELLEKFSEAMVNKIVKLPVLQLKAACKRNEQESLIGVLNDLFDLEKEKETNS